MEAPKKINDPAMLFLAIYLKESMPTKDRDTYMPMFVVTTHRSQVTDSG